MIISYERLKTVVAEVIRFHTQATEDNSQIVADQLVGANLTGHDSHGVGLLPTYIKNFRAGHLSSNAEAKLETIRGAVLTVDGRLGFGQVVGPQAMDMGITHCKELGVAVVALKNSHHLGRLGSLGEYCSAAGLVSMHFVNAVGHEPKVAPFGGIHARLNTNPLCFSVPVQGQAPLVLDISTSAIAAGKVREAMQKGKSIKEGALIDSSGLPTIDPKVLFSEPAGALTHFGDHKGFGLAVICEVLGGALAASWTIQPEHKQVGTNINNMLSILIDPSFFGNHANFEHELLALFQYLKSSPPQPGVDSVLIAGEPEQKTMAFRLKNGIPINDVVWSQIADFHKSTTTQ